MLTPKQEAFCLAYIETGNASEAYRRSYSAEGMKPETINRKAFDLLQDGKIGARIDELRAPVIERVQVTLEQHLEELVRIRDAALSAEKYGPAVTAEVARGKALGFYSEKVELTGKGGGPLQQIALSPAEFAEVARKVAGEV